VGVAALHKQKTKPRLAGQHDAFAAPALGAGRSSCSEVQEPGFGRRGAGGVGAPRRAHASRAPKRRKVALARGPARTKAAGQRLRSLRRVSISSSSIADASELASRPDNASARCVLLVFLTCSAPSLILSLCQLETIGERCGFRAAARSLRRRREGVSAQTQSERGPRAAAAVLFARGAGAVLLRCPRGRGAAQDPWQQRMLLLPEQPRSARAEEQREGSSEALRDSSAAGHLGPARRVLSRPHCGLRASRQHLGLTRLAQGAAASCARCRAAVRHPSSRRCDMQRHAARNSCSCGWGAAKAAWQRRCPAHRPVCPLRCSAPARCWRCALQVSRGAPASACRCTLASAQQHTLLEAWPRARACCGLLAAALLRASRTSPRSAPCRRAAALCTPHFLIPSSSLHLSPPPRFPALLPLAPPSLASRLRQALSCTPLRRSCRRALAVPLRIAATARPSSRSRPWCADHTPRHDCCLVHAHRLPQPRSQAASWPREPRALLSSAQLVSRRCRCRSA
jgi:hypothetical protein